MSAGDHTGSEELAARIAQQEQELRILLAGMHQLASSLDIDRVLATIVRQLAQTLNVERCVLFTYEAPRELLHMIAVHDERGEAYTITVPNLPLSHYPQIRQVIESGEVLAVSDAQGPEVDNDTRMACRELGIFSFLFLPLRYAGEPLGVVGLDELKQQRSFTERELAFGQGLADQAAAALWNARLFAQMQREQAELREINAQQRLLLEVIHDLSTPVVPIMEGILVLPLIGVIDSQRAEQITDGLLAAIEREQARVVIIDITGVGMVDTRVAQYLIQALKAANLLGAEGIVTGIRPEVAQTIVGLGIGLDDFATVPDLRRGVEYALRRIGRRIVTI